jgi:hypothetical protein
MNPDSYILLEKSDLRELQLLSPIYRQMLLTVLDAIIDRFDSAYGFIDTKIDIFTGAPLSRKTGDIDIFGRETVYAWIQSRGVEALCGHLQWIQSDTSLPAARKRHYTKKLIPIISGVINKLESIRNQNGGSLFFWFTPDGAGFTLTPDGKREPFTPPKGRSNTSDMFHVKAVAAAAHTLGDPRLAAEAQHYFDTWIQNVEADRSDSDQQPFDPRNPVVPVPGRRSHGVRMISLGSFALYASLFSDPSYVEGGLRFIQHILDNYINLHGQFNGLEPLDFVEFIDPQGAPFPHEGNILCDPGHGLEFVGLGMKFLNVIRSRQDLSSEQRSTIANLDRLLPQLLLHSFKTGRNPIGGIYKSVDLITRRPYNSDMPWWNLPETLRAAMSAHNASSDELTRQACREVIRDCSNAFLSLYVRPEVHMMAYQTLDHTGKPIPTVPATPDLDPGYHTGLSVIDFLHSLQGR